MATVAGTAVRVGNDRKFYTAMGVAIAAVVVWGFAPSYYLSRWMPVPGSAPEMSAILHLHGAIFTAWVTLMVVQPMLIASRNLRIHRRLGMFGAGVAAAMVVIGNLSAIVAMNVGFRGLGDPMVFYAVPFFAINTFAVIVFLAIRWRGRPETHKRLILLANVSLLGAAVARIPLPVIQATAPFSFVFLPNLITLAGILYDWRTRGRVHPVWIWGGLATVATQVLMFPVMGSGWWHRFAETMAGLW